MGVAVVNLEPRHHVEGSTHKISIRLHFGSPPGGGQAWDTSTPEVLANDWLAALPSAAVSETAAGDALADVWPSWWAGLSSQQQAGAAHGVHVYASELAAAFAA